jgi:hypothetical protein
MRLWSLHPRYLDTRGLVALWREGLLAKHVLEGKTKGYRHHPQLQRFQAAAQPEAAINAYLKEVYAEACRRGHCFTASKIDLAAVAGRIPVAEGQVAYEVEHLRKKLEQRDPARLPALPSPAEPTEAHPLFELRPGPVEAWEKVEDNLK